MAARRRSGPRRPTEADRYAGRQLRAMRRAAGLTMAQIGERAGMVYQQVHKYEAGQNCLTAGRLAQLATILGCHPADFFAGPAPAVDPAIARALAALTETQRDAVAGLIAAIAAIPPIALGTAVDPAAPPPGTPPAAPGAAGVTDQPAGPQSRQEPTRPTETSGVRPDGP